MSLDDDVEFRDLLSQTLEMNGCLSKIRAQLRASIFLTLDEDEMVQQKEPLANQKVKLSLQTLEGRLMFCLVQEFLEFFNLDFTLSVFNVESYADKCYSYKGRTDILEKISSLSDDPDHPLLLQLVNMAKADNSESKTSTIKSESDYFKDNTSDLSGSVNLSAITMSSPVVNPIEKTFTLNNTYDIPSSNINNFESGVKNSGIKPLSNNLTLDEEELVLQKQKIEKSSSLETLKEDKNDVSKTEKSPMKCSASFLSDLPPIQASKPKCNESTLLPSLYNVCKDKGTAKETENINTQDTSHVKCSQVTDNYQNQEEKSVKKITKTETTSTANDGKISKTNEL